MLLSPFSFHSVSLSKEFLFFPSAILGLGLIFLVEVEELDTLAQDINGLKYSAQVASILVSNEPSISKGMAQLGLKDNQPLVERLDRYNANQPDLAAKPNFTAFPPDLKLSPCKLLFFDIVLNHIEIPSLDEKLKQNKSAAQGGFGRFLHGWWSGGEK